MFRGLYHHSIDAKGRTQCPARFRDVLRALSPATPPVAPASPGDLPADDAALLPAAPTAAVVAPPVSPSEPLEQLIVTTGLDTCLMAYPLSAWLAFEERLAKLPQFDPAVVRLKRIYVASAAECEIDRHGRLLLPPSLRAYAGLQKELVWAGMVGVCEIWDAATWEARLAASRADMAGVAKTLTELGL